MIVYRLSREKYKDELSGYGASIDGQRWNSKGVEVVYTAQTRALANSEVAVHLPLILLPKDYFMLEIQLPETSKILELDESKLPVGWYIIPGSKVSQKVGDDFVSSNQFLVLKVPSVVVKGEYNFVINPRHADFSKVRIISASPFPFDPRYLRS